MSYSTRAEVREMIKEDALNSIAGDAYHDTEERSAMIGPLIDGRLLTWTAKATAIWPTGTPAR